MSLPERPGSGALEVTFTFIAFIIRSPLVTAARRLHDALRRGREAAEARGSLRLNATCANVTRMDGWKEGIQRMVRTECGECGPASIQL